MTEGHYVTIADTNLQDKDAFPSADTQIVYADDRYIGLNTVTIAGDSNLIPENIKEGTSIFGVTGSYHPTDITFTVADGNTIPQDPQNNVIWVQTDTAIPSYSIMSSLERPINPIEGMVWIVNGQTSAGAFDVTLDNSQVMVYPQKAYQYISGEWTPRPIKIYKDGQWIDLFTAVINITYPAGANCICTNGVVTYYAPDTTGVWELTVPSQGSWTISASDNTNKEIDPVTVLIEKDQEVKSADLVYFTAYISVKYPSVSGSTVTISLNGISQTASGGGTKKFTVNQRGTWSIKGTYKSLSASTTAKVSTAEATTSATISYKKMINSSGATCEVTSRAADSNNKASKSVAAGTANVTDYTKLYVVVTQVYSYYSWGGTSISLGTVSSSASNGTMVMDITNISGNQTLYLNANTYSQDGQTVSVRRVSISSAWIDIE